MLLDNRKRFALQIPSASYAMLRPYVPPALAAANTGRIVGMVESPSADLLVPTVLHTLHVDELPRSLRPTLAGTLTSLPPDAFVVYQLVARLHDGRTVRCLRRYSEIRAFVAKMKSKLALYDVVYFPWKMPHHAMVDINYRKSKLEAYLSLLFGQNAELQQHPDTLEFLTHSDACDLSIGVLCNTAAPSGGMPTRANNRRASREDGSGETASGRFVVSPTKRLITVVIDVSAAAVRVGREQECAATAGRLTVDKLRQATHGDLADARVIALMGLAPLSVVQNVSQAICGELGEARGAPALSTEPNMQLLRAFHYHDKAGTGLLPSFTMGRILTQLGVLLPPEVATDLLQQAVVDGETCALWDRAAGSIQGIGQDRSVDYHLFLVLLVAQTQSRANASHQVVLNGNGGRNMLAQAYARTDRSGGGGAPGPMITRLGQKLSSRNPAPPTFFSDLTTTPTGACLGPEYHASALSLGLTPSPTPVSALNDLHCPLSLVNSSSPTDPLIGFRWTLRQGSRSCWTRRPIR